MANPVTTNPAAAFSEATRFTDMVGVVLLLVSGPTMVMAKSLLFIGLLCLGGMAIGGVNFTDLKWTLSTNPDVFVKYGAFLQTIFDFLIIALVLFIAIRAINKLQKPSQPAAPPAPPREEVLLQEIRDLLARQYR